MLFQKSAVYHGFLLISIGIQVATHIFHAVQDVPCPSLAGTFKYKVFYKMCHTLLIGEFVARTGIDGETTISHVGHAWGMNDTQSVGQDKSIVWHKFSSLN